MLSSWKASASVTCAVTKSLLTAVTNPFLQQSRNTVILKRKYEPLLTKTGSRPRKLTHKYFIYEIVENTNLKRKPPIDVILTQYVEGYGEKGEKISLKPNKAYNNFLLPGLAVYASPENIKKYLAIDKQAEKVYSSLFVSKLLHSLSKYFLTVNMSIQNPWVIEKWHIKANFRRYGYIVPEDAITLPEKEISGPNLDIENKEFYITVTINKTEKVTVRCRIHHDTYDLSQELPSIENRHLIPAEAVFPEDQEFLDSLPSPVPLVKK